MTPSPRSSPGSAPVTYASPSPSERRRSSPLPEWAGAAWAGSSAQVVTADSDALVRDLVHAGVEFHDLQVRGATLEEAFLAMTRSGAEGRATDTNPAGPPAPTRQEQR